MTATDAANRPLVTVVPALDGLRAVAAGLVILTHAAFLTGFGATGGLMGRLWARGDFGVGIFFALSGFLLHRGLVSKDASGRLDVLGYALRRLARVVPAYWVTLAAVVVFANPPLRDWLLHAALLQIYVPDAWISSFGQSWSLATEISFYAALPLVVMLLRPLRRRDSALPLVVLITLALVTTLASGLGAGEVFGEDVQFHMWLHARAPQFLVGMICAEALRVPSHRASRRLTAWGSDPVVCLALAGGAYLLGTTPIAGSLTIDAASGAELIARTALCTVVALALLLPLTQGGHSAYRAVLSHDTARWLGRVSPVCRDRRPAVQRRHPAPPGNRRPGDADAGRTELPLGGGTRLSPRRATPGPPAQPRTPPTRGAGPSPRRLSARRSPARATPGPRQPRHRVPARGRSGPAPRPVA